MNQPASKLRFGQALVYSLGCYRIPFYRTISPCKGCSVEAATHYVPILLAAMNIELLALCETCALAADVEVNAFRRRDYCQPDPERQRLRASQKAT